MKTIAFYKLLASCILLFGVDTAAQVGINTATPDPSALLDIQSNNKGLLLNKVNLTSRQDITTIPNPTKGLLVISNSDAGSGLSRVYKDLIYFLMEILGKNYYKTTPTKLISYILK